MKTIWKYSLTVGRRQEVSMPRGAEILTVKCQKISQADSIEVWALVDSEKRQDEKHVFSVYGTGHEVSSEKHAYLDTVVCLDGDLVWHVFHYKMPPPQGKGNWD